MPTYDVASNIYLAVLVGNEGRTAEHRAQGRAVQVDPTRLTLLGLNVFGSSACG